MYIKLQLKGTAVNGILLGIENAVHLFIVIAWATI